MDFVLIWYYDRHWSKVFISTISTHDCDLEVEVTDLEVKVFVKVFKTSLFPNLITDLIHLWYDDTYWSKILRCTIPTTLGQGQGHRLRIFILKFYVKVDLITTKLNDRLGSYLVLW